jgi:hypothetical protein
VAAIVEKTMVMDTDKAVADEHPAAAAEDVRAPTDPASMEAIKERLQFFFSDANIRQDVFLRKLLLPDPRAPEAASPQVPIETLLRFNTIKKYTTDAAVVVQAAQALADQLLVSEDQLAIRRIVPFTAARMDDNIPLSLLVQNVPVSPDGHHYAATPEEIRQLFQPYGTVVMVKLRFHQKQQQRGGGGDGKDKQKHGGTVRKVPDGSCLVEFETSEACQKAVADLGTAVDGDIEPKKKRLVLHDQELQVQPLETYISSRKKRKAESSLPDDANKTGTNDTTDGSSITSKARPVFTFDWKPGCVIQLDQLPADTDRESILDAVAQAMNQTVEQLTTQTRTIYADYSRGQTKGAVRFAAPSPDVQAVCDQLAAGTVTIRGQAIHASILAGVDETKYWHDFVEFKNKQVQHRFEERASRKKPHHKPRNGGPSR